MHMIQHAKHQICGQFYPNVIVAKPVTDICLTCQQNTSKLQRAACLKAHQDHLSCGQTERVPGIIRTRVQTPRKLLKRLQLKNCLIKKAATPSSYTQQSHATRPTYFKPPKYGIFGVMYKGLARQVNFLIDEARG